MRVGDLPMADRFAYAFRKWRFGASGTVKEGEFCMARACLTGAGLRGEVSRQFRSEVRLTYR